jgi:EPS-associated MarR family transcriptional regulator
MIEYKVLKEIEKNSSHTQRTLAEKLGVSLGKINYVLGGLIDKGIIKAKKLRDKPGTIHWKYILTPKGIREKVYITHKYLNRRLEEFESIKKEIAELQNDISNRK